MEKEITDTNNNELDQETISSVIKVVPKKPRKKQQPPDIMLSILTRYMKKQNLLLLKKIADHKNVDFEKLKLDYLKPNYFTPRIE